MIGIQRILMVVGVVSYFYEGTKLIVSCLSVGRDEIIQVYTASALILVSVSGIVGGAVFLLFHLIRWIVEGFKLSK